MWLQLRGAAGGLAARWASLSFDSRGRSEDVALPVGQFRVTSDPRDPTFRLESLDLDLRGDSSDPVCLTLASCAFRIEATDADGRPLSDVGILASPGTSAVRAHWFRFEREKVMTQRGVFRVGPGAGDLRRVPHLVSQPGPWTIEAYRPGHRPARVTTTLVAGRIMEIPVILEDSTGDPWDPWAREASNVPEDVLR